jgi:hypothetical protein
MRGEDAVAYDSEYSACESSMMFAAKHHDFMTSPRG